MTDTGESALPSHSTCSRSTEKCH